MLRPITQPLHQEFLPVVPGVPDSQNSLNLKLIITIQKDCDGRRLAATIRPVWLKQRHMENIMYFHGLRQQELVCASSHCFKNLKWPNEFWKQFRCARILESNILSRTRSVTLIAWL